VRTRGEPLEEHRLPSSLDYSYGRVQRTSRPFSVAVFHICRALDPMVL
jgi:hypothetical protein